MLAYDIDETPPPDISTELTILCRQLNHRKPSIGEIALNQPPSNPVLVRLHRQLLTTMRLANGLKLSNSSTTSLFEEKDQLQFFKPLDKNYQQGITPHKVSERRREYFLETIGNFRFMTIYTEKVLVNQCD